MRNTVSEMQRIRKATAVTICLAAIVFLPLPFANAQGQGRGKGNSAQQHGKKSQAPGKQGGQQSAGNQNQSISVSLLPAQVEQLVRMVEEEKLAHDVYLALAKSSSLQIFTKIAQSESQHMRAVEQLVASLAPASVRAKTLPAGSFSNPQFQTLYNELVASGIASPSDAVKVGIKIEEMDIKDLKTLLSQNLPQEVARVLEHLHRGSEHHLRAFVGELNRLGVAYTPQFLKQNEFDKIVNSENRQLGAEQTNEMGKGFGKGKPKSNDGQKGPQSKKDGRGPGPDR